MKISHVCFLACVLLATVKSSVNPEPGCSKYDFEIRTLETMLRTEISVEKMKAEVSRTLELVTEKLNQIDDYKTKISNEVEMVKQQLQDEVKRQIQEMKQEAKELVDRVGSELQRVDVLAAEVKSGPAIAFSVADPTRSLVKGVPTFKEVITNIGNAYDQDTGVFTSPVDGLFLFFLSVYSVGGTNSYCSLLHNGSAVVIAQSNGYSYITAANAVYLSLKKGDTASPGSCGGVNKFYQSNRGTSFSGHLIKLE